MSKSSSGSVPYTSVDTSVHDESWEAANDDSDQDYEGSDISEDSELDGDNQSVYTDGGGPLGKARMVDDEELAALLKRTAAARMQNSKGT